MPQNAYTELGSCLAGCVVVLKRSMLAALAAGGLAGPAASADWVAARVVDEFDGKHRYIAASSRTEPMLAFVCEADTRRIKLLYKTNERTPAEVRKRLPVWPIRIALIVDDQPVRFYPGTMSEIDRRIMAESYDDGVIAFAGVVSGAERRVLVAIDVFGEKRFRHEFAVSGSGKAIPQVLKSCARQPS